VRPQAAAALSGTKVIAAGHWIRECLFGGALGQSRLGRQLAKARRESGSRREDSEQMRSWLP